MAATRTPGNVTAPYTRSWIVLGFLKLWRGAAPDRRRRLSTTGVRLSVCESGWRSSFVGVGLSIDELPKDCVQRGALDCRAPAAAHCWLWSPGSWGRVAGASTGVAAVAIAGFLATDAVTEPATMS